MLWPYCLQEKRFLISIFFLSLLMRLLLFACFLSKDERYLVYFDSAQYQTIAQSIAAGKGVTNSDGTPNFYRLPGYPAFLAGCYTLFNNSVNAALIIQIILSCLVPVLMFCLALVLFGQQLLLAKMVALVAAFHLGFVIYAGMLATESLFTLFFLLFLIFAFRRCIFCAGLMLGIASLIRPIGHFLLPVTLSIIFLSQGDMRMKIKSASTFLLAWFLIVFWWLLRNWLLTGVIFFHTLPGLHFLQYTTAKVVMELRDCSYVQARGDLLDEWKNKIQEQELLKRRVLSEPGRCAVAEKITFFYCKQRPFTVIKNCMCEMIKTVLGLYSAQLIFADTQEWTDYSTSNIWSKLKKYIFPRVNTWYLVPLTWFEIVYSFFLLIGFVGFCIRAIINRSIFYSALQSLLFIFVLIGLTCAYGCARLRLPLEPLWVIVSMHWWVWIFTKILLAKRPLFR